MRGRDYSRYLSYLPGKPKKSESETTKIEVIAEHFGRNSTQCATVTGGGWRIWNNYILIALPLAPPPPSPPHRSANLVRCTSSSKNRSTSEGETEQDDWGWSRSKTNNYVIKINLPRAAPCSTPGHAHSVPGRRPCRTLKEHNMLIIAQ